MHQLVMTLGKHHGEHFSDRKENEAFLYRLFPKGPVLELCKLAGLLRGAGAPWQCRRCVSGEELSFRQHEIPTWPLPSGPGSGQPGGAGTCARSVEFP